MVRLDTIKLSMPYDVVSSFNINDERVINTIYTQDGSSKQTIRIEGDKSFGISSSFIKNEGREVVLNMSAKCLFDNYLESININTIDEALSNYNQYSPLKVDVQKAIENSRLYICDSTQMIYPNYDLNMCKDSLLVMRTNSRCDVKPYSGRNQCGIVFNSSTKKEKRRLTIYSKELDLTKAPKSHRVFLGNCSNALKIINDSKGSFRVEQNSSGRRSILKRFDIEDNTLLNVLNSSKNPNYDYLMSISKDSKQLDLFLDSYSDYSLSQLEKRVGIETICNRFDRDIELIRGFIKSKVTHRNHYRHFNKYIEVISDLEKREFLERNKISSTKINNHIFELIKTAA